MFKGIRRNKTDSEVSSVLSHSLPSMHQLYCFSCNLIFFWGKIWAEADYSFPHFERFAHFAVMLFNPWACQLTFMHSKCSRKRNVGWNLLLHNLISFCKILKNLYFTAGQTSFPLLKITIISQGYQWTLTEQSVDDPQKDWWSAGSYNVFS